MGTTTLVQCGPGSNDNKGVFCIPQITRTGTSLLDGSSSYPGESFGRFYLIAEMQLVYSTVSANKEGKYQKYTKTNVNTKYNGSDSLTPKYKMALDVLTWH